MSPHSDYGWKNKLVVIDADEGKWRQFTERSGDRSVTRDGFYTFNDVSANHTIASPLWRTKRGNSRFWALKTYIESYIWAYWTDNISKVPR